MTNSNFANADSKNSNFSDSANTNSNFGSLASKDGINFKAVLSGETSTGVGTEADTTKNGVTNQPSTQTAQTVTSANQPSDEIIKNTLEYHQQDNSQNAHLTFYIHGTFSEPNAVDREFINAVSKTYGEPVAEFDWSGHDGNNASFGTFLGADNTKEARTNAAKRLAAFMQENYDGSLNIICHSHGCNVAKEAIGIDKGEKVDNFYMFNGPVREDYNIDFSKFKSGANIVNVYDKSDLVQVGGGTDTKVLKNTNYGMQPFSSLGFFSWTNRVGVANRTIDDTRVRNVEVRGEHSFDNPWNAFKIYRDYIDVHSNTRTKEIWNEINKK